MHLADITEKGVTFQVIIISLVNEMNSKLMKFGSDCDIFLMRFSVEFVQSLSQRKLKL